MADLTGGGESSLDSIQSGATLKNKSDTATSGRQSVQRRNVKKSNPGEEDDAGNALTKSFNKLNEKLKDVYTLVGQNLSYLFTTSTSMLALHLNVGSLDKRFDAIPEPV